MSVWQINVQLLRIKEEKRRRRSLNNPSSTTQKYVHTITSKKRPTNSFDNVFVFFFLIFVSHFLRNKLGLITSLISQFKKCSLKLDKIWETIKTSFSLFRFSTYIYNIWMFLSRWLLVVWVEAHVIICVYIVIMYSRPLL